MKLYLLPLLLFCAHACQSQVRDKQTKQIEQLQQLKQNISRKIDSLQVQLPGLVASIENARKKIDQLKKEAYSQDRPDAESKEQLSKLTVELNNANNLADGLRRQFDSRIIALDKALNLQKDLEDKITALAKEGNR